MIVVGQSPPVINITATNSNPDPFLVRLKMSTNPKSLDKVQVRLEGCLACATQLKPPTGILIWLKKPT